MAAYILVDQEITDQDGYNAYGAKAGPTIAQYGGKVRIVGGNAEALEGDWKPARVILIEFPDKAAALAWYNSAEYAEPKQMRFKAAKSNLLVVEGL
ncbi:hypothetical protein AYO38_03780 [bacterium SCGC AG-212-C10]|nr:hypothetical protein AYO38_03780 [bacterium SCGC AG-212-C10]